MDDSFGTILYIIIALVAFVISALGKKKKRDAQRTVPINKTNDNYKKESSLISNIGRLLNEESGIQNHDIFGGSYEENYEEEVIEEKEVALDVVPPEMPDDKEDVPYSIEFNDTSEMFAKPIPDSEIKSEEEENPILEGFDLQKAVIYSEIITRKYF